MIRDTKWKRNLTILTAIVSVLVLLCGLALITAGAFALRWTRGGGGELVDPRDLDTSAAMLVVVGCLTVFLGIAGLCICYLGVTFKRVAVLSIFLLSVIFLDLSAGSLALLWKGSSSNQLVERTLKDIRFRYGHYESDNTSRDSSLDQTFGRNQALTDRIDATQEKLQCCGSASPLDYVGSRWHGGLCTGSNGDLCDEGPRVPPSCCLNASLNPISCPAARNSYRDGCAVVIVSFVTESSKTVTWPSFVVAFLMLLCWCLKVFALVELQIRERRHSTVKALTFSAAADQAQLAGPLQPEESTSGGSQPTSQGVHVYPHLRNISPKKSQITSSFEETHF